MRVNELSECEGMDISWQIKNIGDPQSYTLTTKEGGTTVYSTNVLKSIRWPGAVTVCSGGRFLSIYMGNGVKMTGASYEPLAPVDIKDEPDDMAEHPEPNPKNPPKPKLETDTDAKNPDEQPKDNDQ